MLKLKSGVHLVSALICYSQHHVVLVSNIGRTLKFAVNDTVLPMMGRLAQGPIAMRLFPGEQVLGAVACNVQDDSTMLVATDSGVLIRLATGSIPSCQRGDLGAMPVCLGGQKLLHPERMVAVCRGSGMVGVETNQGRCCRLWVNQLPVSTPKCPETKILPLRQGESLINLTPLVQEN